MIGRFKKLFCFHVYIKVFPLNVWEQTFPFLKGEWFECVKCGRQKGKITINIESYLIKDAMMMKDYTTNVPWKGAHNDGIARKHTRPETNQ